MQMRADAFKVLRTKTSGCGISSSGVTVAHRSDSSGYDISLLFTDAHCESMMKRELVEFVVAFIEGINQEISELKLAINARARVCCEEYLKKF